MSAQAGKKITTGMTGDVSDVTDNDPIDPGQKYLTRIYELDKTPNDSDYKFAKKVSNNKKNKYFTAIIVANVGFWMYMLLDYIARFMGG